MTLTNHSEDPTAEPLTSAALLELLLLSDPQLTPDGRHVVAVVTDVVSGASTGNESDGDAEPPRYRSRLQLFPTQPDEHGDYRPRPLTTTELKDSSPRLSPDGTHLAFLRQSEAEKPPQLHLMPLGSAGEPRRLTSHEAGVGEFAWCPDGSALVYVSQGERVDDRAKRGVGRRIKRLRYRGDGQGFLPEAAADLYRVDLAGDVERLTTSEDDAVFSAPHSLAFAADGSQLYFCRANDEATANDFRSDIMALDLKTHEASVLLTGVLGVGSLAPSPAGRYLAYTAASLPDDLASCQGVWLLELEGGLGAGAPRLLSGASDVAPAEASDSRFGRLANAPTWRRSATTAGGPLAGATDDAAPATATGDPAEHLLVNVHAKGRTGLYRLDLDGRLEPLAPGDAGSHHASPRAITAFTALPQRPAGGAGIAFLAESSVTPGELWISDVDFGSGGAAAARDAGGSAAMSERRLSSLNDAWCRRYRLLQPAGPFRLEAGEGGPGEESPADVPAEGREAVEYWTLSPRAARGDDAVVIEVHGGPHAAYGNGFMFEFQLLAARGYRVVYGNPRGSSSYGHHFATCMLGSYGSLDADDVMAIVDAALVRLAVPAAPVHLTGGSYGGFMTNWLLGVSERFTSAVSQRSICNWTSMYGTSDIGPSFVEREIGGVPWSDVETLWRQSPLRNAGAVTTPLLLIHAEEDYRCPIEQAEQFFSALKRLGRTEVELLRFPGEGHELSRSGRPDRRIERLDAIVEWFERHP